MPCASTLKAGRTASPSTAFNCEPLPAVVLPAGPAYNIAGHSIGRRTPKMSRTTVLSIFLLAAAASAGQPEILWQFDSGG